MKRWEFDCIAQAAECISSCFPGTHYKGLLLKQHLDSAIGEVFYDAQENFPTTSSSDDDGNTCSDNVCAEDESSYFLGSTSSLYQATMENRTSIQHSPPPHNGPYKRRKVIKPIGIGVEVDIYSEETCNESIELPTQFETYCESDCDNAVEATQYRDSLILIWFNDRDLPFKLREIIMSDLRLLTLLESGLPSWVIFLQSYLGFCHLYRPWICPLARALYVIISVVTVLIGFYDLYKNVPVLKATASRLCGPLFDWIETWEMISRIRYLGTMLFLHNFQKAVKRFLMITRSTRSFLSILTEPMVAPLLAFVDILLPFWNVCMKVLEDLCSIIWTVIWSSCSLVENLIGIVLLPMLFILSVIWSIAMSIIYPIFWILWELLYAPVRLVLGVASFVAFICTFAYDFLGDIWLFVSNILQFASNAEATVNTYEVSMWCFLWNDLFSQVFSVVRSILNGFVAFFTACSRHRLNIYNHTQEFIQRLSCPTQRFHRTDSSHKRTCRTQYLVILPALEELDICGLPSLKEIWPKQLPAESFCELENLTVTKCDNLFRVFPCNLSLMLQKLKKLNVEECDSVEEVLEEGQYSVDKVVIYNMASLKLTNLPKLRNFYSGNLTLKFSSLEDVRLKDCPNMHTFSSGLVITPKLHMIKVNDNKKPLNGDLNSTIQQLFEIKEEEGEEPVTAQGIHGEILE